MSEDESWSGTLQIVVIENTLTETIKSISKRNGYSTLPVVYESWVEFFEDYSEDFSYMFNGKEIYHVTKIQGNAYYHSTGTINQEGSIDFSCCFYNGGAGLNEVLQECIENSKETECET